MKQLDPEKIKWRIHKGEAGDLQTLLIGEYNGIEFSALYNDNSFFNISLRWAKWRITQAIKLLY